MAELVYACVSEAHPARVGSSSLLTPTMDIVNTVLSSALGFASGLVSSYIFWKKQRQLDKPRLEFSIETPSPEPQDMVFSLKNKGGSFAERITYSFGHFHDPDELDDTQLVHFDEALAPDEKWPMRLELDPDEDAIIEFEYSDVFGNKYKDVWQLHPLDEPVDPYYLVVRRDE